MAYTQQEEDELNKQLAKWKKRQLAAVKKNNIDYVFEKMYDAHKSIWEQIARAETYKDVSTGAWNFAEEVIDRYCKMAK